MKPCTNNKCGDFDVDFTDNCKIDTDLMETCVDYSDLCEWKDNEDYENPGFETGCGEAFIFIEGSIEENNFNYCPHCGGKISAP